MVSVAVETGIIRESYQKVGLLLGPAVALTVLLSPPPGDLSPEAWRAAAMGLLMAIWWATEAVPIAVTALLPLVFFPMLGIANISETAAPFANKNIYLFLGGFIIAFGMQRWDLHRRIALNVLQFVGGNGRSLVGGFMLASGLLSMWVMNTSTTMMLLPIGVSIIGVIHANVEGLTEEDKVNFQCALLLGIAYAASIGGMATLVGTAPNAMMAAFVAENYQKEIDFARWMMVGLPLSLVMLPLAWVTLTRFVFPLNFETSNQGKAKLREMRDEMGAISVPEIRVALIFVCVALAWITRPLLSQIEGLSQINDSTIAIAGAIALFVIPAGQGKGDALLDWGDLEKLPWGILLLFGGGLTLAAAVSSTGLALWIGTSLNLLGTLPLIVLVAVAAALIIFLTELTSNIATTATFLPVVAAVAIEAGIDPILLTVPVTFAASCAFMLPVATPPNAIVFGSGMLRIPQMMRAGFALNLVGILIVSTAAILLAPRVF